MDLKIFINHVTISKPIPTAEEKYTYIYTDRYETDTDTQTHLHAYIQNLTSVYIKDKPSKGRSQRSKITSSGFFYSLNEIKSQPRVDTL